jgi:exodeoxyribonuclease III
MKIISWNVNGIRAIAKKGFKKWLDEENPDILGIQEIKAKEENIPKELLNQKTYNTVFNPAERKGYSGVAIFSKLKAKSIKNGFGIEKFDIEGRLIEADFGDFILLNVYFPNGKMSPQRLNYKIDFYNTTIKHIKSLLEDNKKIIIMGDFNTAHKEIDLARPKENESVSGFLKIERALLDDLEKLGMIDAFRHLNKDPNNYTWWSVRTRARERNVGWRIDYAFISQNLRKNLKSCTHLKDVEGSDHCPVLLELK